MPNAQTTPAYRVLYNQDCTNLFSVIKEPITPEHVDAMVDEPARGGADLVLINPNAQRVNYPSNVHQTFWDGYSPGDAAFFGDAPEQGRQRREHIVAQMKRLADEGQRPRAMVISCCDSRVHVTSIFGADQGEFFIHRNIASLVPPCEPDGDHHGTSAAVEYAVTALKVAHVVVLGHAGCGGVRGCHDMCSGAAPELEERSSFVGRWMDILRPGYARLDHDAPRDDQLRALEKAAVLVSLENLMTFPFVADAVAEDRLTLHGLWTDTGEGVLENHDPAQGGFVSL